MESIHDFDPQVLRSHRNRERNAVDNVSNFELGTIRRQKQTTTLEEATSVQEASARLALVSPNEYFGYFSTSALILNKMFGSAIFVTPAIVLTLTNSKCTSLMLWLFGSLVTWSGVRLYLEYGIRFPLNGGELYYVDYVWTKPRMLMAYLYSFPFFLISGSAASALTFGKSIIISATTEEASIDPRLQKFFAILVIGVICQLHAFSRINYIRFNNLFAIYKIFLLSILTVTGWHALSGQRSEASAAMGGPYGLENLRSDFDQTVFQPFSFAIALLNIMRAFLGYENANYVLEEVRRKPGDESAVYRRAAKLTVSIVTFFYLMVNVAFFAACGTDELIDHPDTLTLFFQKAYGSSNRARTAAGALQAISAFGNMMSYIYSNVRVKQEIARSGITPFPQYFARTNADGAPGPALLLTFIFTSIMILATPLSNANGYLIMSTLFTYFRTYVAVILSLGLLAAPRLQSFNFNGHRWKPQGSAGGLKVLTPLLLLYLLSNLFVLVLSWWPADIQKTLRTQSPILPSLTGPVIGISLIGAGGLYWLWDIHILKALGWTCTMVESEPENGEVNLLALRDFSGPAEKLYLWYQRQVERFEQLITYMKDRWATIARHL